MKSIRLINRRLFIVPFFTMLILFGCSKEQDYLSGNYRLWYDEPAKEWIEALPVGNGRMGAMVFGNPQNERIQFNEESLWAGSKIDNNNPLALDNLPAIQQLIFNGEYKKAYEMAGEYLLGTPPNVRSYQTFGDLILNYHWENEVTNYRRELDLGTGIATTTFQVNESEIKQEVFATSPDNLIVVRVSASKPFGIDVQLKREKDAEVVAMEGGKIVMKGQIIDPEEPARGPAGAHMKFSAIASLNSDGGTSVQMEDGLSFASVNSITVYLSLATNYDFDNLDISEAEDPVVTCESILNSIEKKSYSEIKDTHIKDHQDMFNRVSLILGPDTLQYMPTDERLERVKNGAVDNGLVSTYFQYGRYLLMGSSRKPGILPANLQGVWNDHFNAPWNADFHTNINLQMNYWPAEVCNLPETSLILTGFMEKLAAPGQVAARKMYGAKGWTFHHLTDPFGRTGVADGVWGITPLDGPWMTFPLYRHYEYSRDKEYLRRIYPLIKGSAEFVTGFLIESPEGYLVTNPSHSPENAFFVPGSDKKERSALTYAATIDIQIINKLIDCCTEASDILDIDKDFAHHLLEIKKKLPPVQIGENGTIQEWIHDYEEVEIGHRHMSHLLGLYPLAQITVETPELFEAAKNTIQRRLANGGGQTGWSRAWIISFYARLYNGDEAWKHLQSLLANSTLPNLFDTHPPFQIDGNFGATAGIAEMLVQSHHGVVRLLPALPDAWSEGSVTGLKVRGGFECDIHWKEGKLKKAVLESENGGKVDVKYGSDKINVELEPGGEYIYLPK